MTKYRAMGTTDEVTECQVCGKPELKGTVILGILDADGNVEETIYAGSTCAARKVGGKAATIRREALIAESERQSQLAYAREIIDAYGPVENDRGAKIELYFRRNPRMRAGIRSEHIEFKGACAEVDEMLADARRIIAANGLAA